MRVKPFRCCTVALILASTPALASVIGSVRFGRPSRPKGEGEVIDVSPVKARLEVLSDGKRHYIVLIPFAGFDGEEPKHYLFYGDGVTFYDQLISGSGGETGKRFEYSFWEPRFGGSVSFEEGKYAIKCDGRLTTLSAVPHDASAPILESATFKQARWTREPDLLGRDQQGTYYYVDKLTDSDSRQGVRLFRGDAGRLKPEEVTSVVRDSKGEAVTTTAGKLIYNSDAAEAHWIAGKSKISLVNLPVDDNEELIYTDLGVYRGERLGTPCDDLGP